MPVTARLPPSLAGAAGGRAAHEAIAGTVRERVALAGGSPELGRRLLSDAREREPYPGIVFHADDEGSRFPRRLAAPVADGGESVIVPAVAGG
jgi:hypothetical protein